jgi:hypothetical protein
MYRDMGNFKNYGEVVFGNLLNRSSEEIRKQIFRFLGSDHIIKASDLRIPDLFFKNFPYDPELDHEMHEFFEVSESELPASDAEQRDIADFLTEIKKNFTMWSL